MRPYTPLPFPIVALVTDRHVCRGIEPLLETVEEAVEGGVNLVQLREKDLSQNDLLDLARELREVTKGKALLFVNSELGVALMAKADGAHLGEAQAGLTRTALQQGLASRSVHTVEGAEKAAKQRADLLVAGPVYHTQTHPSQMPAGIELIERIAGAVNVPVVGIGGITAENAGEVIGAGASGVAVIREILAAADPQEAARKLRDAVVTAWAARTASAAQQA